jgi:hypothetical protein
VQYLKQTAGSANTELAAQFNVSTKTISRDLREELPPEVQQKIDADAAEFRTTFIERAQPLALDLLTLLEAQIAEGELKPRDTLVGLGILSDKIRAMQPRQPVVTQTETLRITCKTPGEEPFVMLDTGKAPGDNAALPE